MSFRKCNCLPNDLPFWTTALGNLAAGYNLAIIGHMLSFVEESGIPVNDTEESMVATAGLVGTMAGQITFGYLATVIGLKRGLAACFFIVGIGAFLSSLGVWNDEILIKLTICRLITGLGIGGVFPISAILAAETNVSGKKTSRIIHSFAFQVWGQLFSSVVALLCNTILPDFPNVSWRICGLVGLFPSLIAISLVIYHRRKKSIDHLRLPENNDEEIVVGESNFSEDDFFDGFVDEETSLQGDSQVSRWNQQNIFKLAGTAGSWFLFDMVYYSNIIFAPFVLDAVFKGAHEEYVLELSCLIGIVALPGVYLSCYLVDSWGAKIIQMIGFGTLICLFSLIAIILSSGANSGQSKFYLFMLYCATFFFYNFGPNSTTFVLPSQIFLGNDSPVFAGISAAIGKSGAVVGSALFKWLLDQFGIDVVMTVSIVICVLAFLFTKFFVDTDRLGLEDAAKEEGTVELTSLSQV